MFSAGKHLVLFLTGLAAGFVDSVAGGGGLITLPVIMSLGLPPQTALGTNKLQATFGSGSATLHFVRKGTINLQACWIGIIATAVSAVLGAYAVQQVPSELLQKLIPCLLLGIGLYALFSPRLGYADRTPCLKANTFHLLFGLLLGFYDGFFGPGTGAFWAIAFVVGLGCNLIKATGYTKVMNFTSNLASLALFMTGGYIDYGQGLVMAIGQMLGARLGSGLVIHKGAHFIRPIFITMVLAITLKLLVQTYYKG